MKNPEKQIDENIVDLPNDLTSELQLIRIDKKIFQKLKDRSKHLSVNMSELTSVILSCYFYDESIHSRIDETYKKWILQKFEQGDTSKSKIK